MKTPAIILTGIITAALMAAVMAFWPKAKLPLQITSTATSTAYVFGDAGETATATRVLTKKFVPPQGIIAARAWRLPQTECRDFRALLVNHHALAADLLSTMAEYVSRCRPKTKTLIIISPDHYAAGSGSITTANMAYVTGDKTIQTNLQKMTSLLNAVSIARQESVLFEREHGIGALIPFFADGQLFEVVPIAIKGRITDTDAKAFTQWLKEVIKDQSILVVLSADMSHYLDKAQALKNDERTLQALNQNEWEFFAKATDDYLDSGVQATMLIQALDKTAFHAMGHKISTDYTNDQSNTTSYIAGVWE